MARKMTAEEIEALIEEGYVARIGCHAGDLTYVVPIAYAYEDGALYGFSHEGMKLDLMRRNPKVCVEIDSVEHLGAWKSVIGWGTFEELHGKEADVGAHVAAARLRELAMDDESRRRLGEALRREPVPVVYRIRLDEKTGRVEGT